MSLLVPPGTSTAELKSVSVQAVDNGAVLTKLLHITEAGRSPYQVQQTLVYPDMKTALETLLKDL